MKLKLLFTRNNRSSFFKITIILMPNIIIMRIFQLKKGRVKWNQFSDAKLMIKSLKQKEEEEVVENVLSTWNKDYCLEQRS